MMIMNKIFYIVEGPPNLGEDNIESFEFLNSEKSPIDLVEEFYNKIDTENIFIISSSKALSGREYIFRSARPFGKNVYFLESKSLGSGPYLLAKYGSTLEKIGFRPREVYNILADKRRDLKFYCILNNLESLKDKNILGNIKYKKPIFKDNYYLLSVDERGILYEISKAHSLKKVLSKFEELIKEDLRLKFNYSMAMTYGDENLRIESEEIILREIEKANFYKALEINLPYGLLTVNILK